MLFGIIPAMWCRVEVKKKPQEWAFTLSLGLW